MPKQEFVLKHDKKIQRLLEILPGSLTWLFMLSPLWLGLVYPTAVIFLLLFLTIYWCYLAVKGSVGLALGYPIYKKEMSMDWWGECKKLNFDDLPEPETRPQTLAQTKHFIVIPAVSEPYDVLKPALDALLNQTFPSRQITLVYSIEEKYYDTVSKTIFDILGPRKDDFDKLLIYKHPAGIIGEAIGSGGGNRTWGGRHAVEVLRAENARFADYIFTSLDADHVLDRQYLARLTHLYLSATKRNNKFCSTAVHLFNNNHWQVPSMMRIEANLVTLGTLANRSIFWKRNSLTVDTFAAFSSSLQTLVDADYWDVSSGVDDTTFYWRAFFVRGGDFTALKHYIPYSADAVEGSSYLKAHKSLYKQLLRWGWGVVEVPMSLKGFMVHPEISFGRKALWVYDHFKTRVLMINAVFLITFGFSLLSLVNPYVKQSSYAYMLPKIMSFILTFTLLFMIPSFIYRAKLTPPIPKSWSFFKRKLVLIEGVLVIFNLLTFSYVPNIEAQTRMMLGKRMKDVYHTPKMRSKP